MILISLMMIIGMAMPVSTQTFHKECVRVADILRFVRLYMDHINAENRGDSPAKGER